MELRKSSLLIGLLVVIGLSSPLGSTELAKRGTDAHTRKAKVAELIASRALLKKRTDKTRAANSQRRLEAQQFLREAEREREERVLRDREETKLKRTEARRLVREIRQNMDDLWEQERLDQAIVNAPAYDPRAVNRTDMYPTTDYYDVLTSTSVGNVRPAYTNSTSGRGEELIEFDWLR